VGDGLHIRQVVDPHHLDVLEQRVLADGPKDVPADPAEAVDADANGHVYPLFSVLVVYRICPVLLSEATVLTRPSPVAFNNSQLTRWEMPAMENLRMVLGLYRLK
jgi:hypothetical protein